MAKRKRAHDEKHGARSPWRQRRGWRNGPEWNRPSRRPGWSGSPGRPAWRRRAWWLGGALVIVAVLYAASTPILQSIGHALVRADVVEKSDAIVELSGGEGDRELETADLYAAHMAPLVVLTTERDDAALPEMLRRGVRYERPVDRRVRYLKELGVPAAAIIVLPNQASSTVDEASIVAAWLKTQAIHRVIVVSSAYHTRRAGHIFEWMLRGANITVRTRPAAQDRFKPDSWWRDRNTLLGGLVEWQKTIYYRLKYW